MSVVVPIGMSDSRLPQAGRIRIGEKTKSRKGRTAIDTFKFTSSDVDLLRPLAEVYGGVVEVWNEPSSGDRWALRSEATKIRVVLPPNPLSQVYEKWDPHLVRRCNGITCTRLMGTRDDAEYQEVDCICARKGELECTYKLRLSVLLAEVPSLGTWRLDTSSENARKEMPAVVEAIEGLQQHGFHEAVLRLEQRRQPGKVINVPVLDPGVSIATLVSGDTRLGQLPAAPSAPSVGELEAAAGDEGPPPRVSSSPAASSSYEGNAGWSSEKDDIVDAEIVEEVDGTIGRAWIENMPATHRNAALIRAREIAREAGEPEPTSAAAIPDHIINRLAAEADL